MNKITLLLGLLVLFFTSCFNGSRELEVPKSKHIYINSISSASSTELRVKAGITIPLIGANGNSENDIELSAHHNSTPIVVKKDGASFIIKLDRELNANDEISLIATSEGIPSISTVARVLDAPKLLRAKGEWVHFDEGSSRVQVKLSIEPTKEVAYYRLIVRSKWYSESLGVSPGTLLERKIVTLGNPLFPQQKDQLFNEVNNAPFALLSLKNESDVTFSYYDVKFENSPDAPVKMDWEYSAEVELQRISKDYYLYLLTCMDSENNNAFENPIKIHSNIIGGFGIFEIYTPLTTPILMK